jgi:hypothetical protein
MVKAIRDVTNIVRQTPLSTILHLINIIIIINKEFIIELLNELIIKSKTAEITTPDKFDNTLLNFDWKNTPTNL